MLTFKTLAEGVNNRFKKYRLQLSRVIIKHSRHVADNIPFHQNDYLIIPRHSLCLIVYLHMLNRPRQELVYTNINVCTLLCKIAVWGIP